MKLGNRSADALAQVDLTVSNANVPTVTSPMPWDKQRRAAVRAAAMLAFAAGLLVALGAGADESARPQETVERGRTDCHCMQPIAKQFAAPNQPDVNPSDARAVDELYHVLIGPQPENSLDPLSITRPTGSVER